MFFTRREFEFPRTLSQVLSRHFWNADDPPLPEVKRFAYGLKQLWPLLAKDRGQKTGAGERHYSMDRRFAEAYAAYYMPANLMKLSLVLEEMRLLGLQMGDSTALRWMDVGSGPGTAFWGLAWWAAHRKLNFEFWGLEQSQQFLKLAGSLSRELSSALFKSPQPVAHWEAFQHAKGAQVLFEKVRSVRPHVLSMLNSLGELEHSIEARKAWMQELVSLMAFQAKADEKPRWLVFIEPGSQAASRELLELRELLRVHPDVKIWLPCLSKRPCGALERPADWCHEETACQFPQWLNVLGAEAGLKKEAVLFSYLVCSVGVHPLKPDSWPDQGFRVVSQRMKEKGLTQCFLCTQIGKKKARVLNSKQTPENLPFLDVVRGQLFRDVQYSDEKGSVEKLGDLFDPTDDLFDPIVFPQPR